MFHDLKFGSPLFDDERSKALIEDSLAKRDRVRVIGFVARLGQYLVVGLGRVRPVVVESDPMISGWQLDHGGRTLMFPPLTVYVKVI